MESKKMKSTASISKSHPSATPSKHRNKSKEGDKEKVPETSSHSNNVSDKRSPPEDSSSGNYVGLSAESIAIYAEQAKIGHLSREVCNMLVEDANYKIRYIINMALQKARLAGQNFISGDVVDQTFADLNIGKVYGAPSNPTWVPFDQNLYYLDDRSVNLIDITREVGMFEQFGNIRVAKKWYPESNIAIQNYFQSMCLSLVDKDFELRKFALTELSVNPYMGPIVEWFYRFGYFLLTKDITYDCLTLYALDLITVLEYNCVTRVNVSEKQLQLLVRLLLQRLLKTGTATDVLKPMCTLLSILCKRVSLEELVYTKIEQKNPQIFLDCSLPVVTLINCLGFRAIKEIFIPNMMYFLDKIKQTTEFELSHAVLCSYNLMCRYKLETFEIYSSFKECFGEGVLSFWKPKSIETEVTHKVEINVVNVRGQLIRTRRKVPCQNLQYHPSNDDVFELETPTPLLRKKLDSHVRYLNNYKCTTVIIGKTCLLLPELAVREKKTVCYDHCLFCNL